MKKFSLSKKERLQSRKVISHLFTSGEHVFQYPFKLVFATNADQDPTIPLKIAVSVPKRRFKLAVQRNLIKRRIKEAYRKQKPEIFEAMREKGSSYDAMVIYVGKEVETFEAMENSIQKLLQKFLKHA